MIHRLALVALGLLSSLPAIATPIYYTFEGSLEVVPSFQPLWPDELQLGEQVKYVISVDKDLPGIGIFHSVLYPCNDTPDYNCFYVSDAAGYDHTSPPILHNSHALYGKESLVNGIPTVQIHTWASRNGIFGNDPREGDRVSIYSDFAMNTWFEGQSGFKFESGSYTTYGHLTLTGISNENPSVPEPSSMILISLGSILLVRYQCRKKEKRMK